MDVIVAGGGIAGLGCAIALARSGHGVRVLERAAHFADQGAGLQIGPNGVQALKWLGVWQSLSANLYHPQSLILMDGVTGARLRAFPLHPYIEQQFGAPYSLCHRSELHAVLLAAVRGESRVELLNASEVVGIDGDGPLPRVTTKPGVALSADAILGADGVRSTVRRFLAGESDNLQHHEVIYRALFARNEAENLPGDVTLWMFPNGHVVHYPLRGGKMTNLVAVRRSTPGQPPSDQPIARDDVLKHFASLSPKLHEILSLPDEWTPWSAADRKPLASWGKGPVTLAGDAAHPMLPYLAQGAMSALEDAVVLGRAMEEARHAAPAFRLYEQLRMGRTGRMQSESRTQAGICHASGIHAGLRNLYLRTVPDWLFFSRLAWIYRWKP